MASMKGNSVQEGVFKKGSRTYFTSSLFFPADVRRDVLILYGFVRVADNFVDATPQDARGFQEFCESYRLAIAGQPSGDPIIDDYVELSSRKRFDPAWTDGWSRQ